MDMKLWGWKLTDMPMENLGGISKCLFALIEVIAIVVVEWLSNKLLYDKYTHDKILITKTYQAVELMQTFDVDRVTSTVFSRAWADVRPALEIEERGVIPIWLFSKWQAWNLEGGEGGVYTANS
jgi:hypothetical protein